MAKINYDEEIKQCNEKIAFYKDKKRRFEQAKKAAENEEIIALIRSNNLSAAELSNLLIDFKGMSKTKDNSNIKDEGVKKDEESNI